MANKLKNMMFINRYSEKKDRRIVWGILTPRELQISYKILAQLLRVPMWVLANYVLESWLRRYGGKLMKDDEVRRRFGEALVSDYLANEGE